MSRCNRCGRNWRTLPGEEQDHDCPSCGPMAETCAFCGESHETAYQVRMCLFQQAENHLEALDGLAEETGVTGAEKREFGEMLEKLLAWFAVQCDRPY